MPAPICLFVYKRLEETILTIESLKKNLLADQSILYIFSDGPKSGKDKLPVEQVRDYIRGVQGFKDVILKESESNKGLAASIISGVSFILSTNDNVIVMEDDLLTSSNFLKFMNDSLMLFNNREDIQSVNGYSPFIKKINPIESDIYLHYRTFSWGWATWKKYWKPEIFSQKDIRRRLNPQILIDFDSRCGNDMSNMLKSALDKKIDSWYIFWAFDHFKNDRLAIYPYISKIENIGYGIESTHCDGILTIISKFDSEGQTNFNLPKDLQLFEKEVKNVNQYFTKIHKLIFRIVMLKNPKNFPLLWNELKKKLSFCDEKIFD